MPFNLNYEGVDSMNKQWTKLLFLILNSISAFRNNKALKKYLPSIYLVVSPTDSSYPNVS